jgi:hypothetical protein
MSLKRGYGTARRGRMAGRPSRLSSQALSAHRAPTPDSWADFPKAIVVLCISFSVPCLLGWVVLNEASSGLVTGGIPLSLLAFALPRGRWLFSGATGVLLLLSGVFVGLEYAVAQEGGGAGSLIMAGMIWLMAVFAAGSFFISMVLRLAFTHIRGRIQEGSTLSATGHGR